MGPRPQGGRDVVLADYRFDVPGLTPGGYSLAVG